MDAIVYTSNTGSTAHYAAMLGDKLGLPVFSAEEAKKRVAAGTEILYLGWIMAGEVKGYKAAAQKYKICVVCGVGMGMSGTQLEEVRKRNAVPAEIPLFTLQGGFDIRKLHGVYKVMMNVMSKTAGKSLAEKNDRTPEEDDMLDMMQHGGDRVREENLHEVLAYLQNQAEKC